MHEAALYAPAPPRRGVGVATDREVIDRRVPVVHVIDPIRGVSVTGLAGNGSNKPDTSLRANSVRTSNVTRECPRVTGVVHFERLPRDLQGILRSPLTDSNRRPPPSHADPAATGRTSRQRFSPVRAVFAAVPFATDCDRLRPLGSIKAPSFVARSDYEC